MRALCISSLFGRLLLIPGSASPKNWHDVAVVVVVPSRIAIKPGLPKDYFSFSQNRSALTSEKNSFLLERVRDTHTETDRESKKERRSLFVFSFLSFRWNLCALCC